MFVQSNGTSHSKHVDGICLTQRRAGRDTLVQWSNGDRRWEPTSDLEGNIVLMGNGDQEEEEYNV